ncbi:MAG: carbohydrate-binding domain-containing protein [Bacteroidales bacterium]|nr:carbohydrate-binding domain-containing protein [Bacteroidales bacterium]
MKRLAVWLLMPAVLVSGCSKDSIIDTDAGENIAPVPGTEEDNDSTEETALERTITIVFSDESGATVTGDENGMVKVDGNRVTADNSAYNEIIEYILKGSTTNGFFKSYSGNRQTLVLDGVSITNPSGAAINNQGKKKCYIVVNGTNTLSDAASASYDSGEEDMKAVLFSEGQLLVSGSGSLTVTASNAAGKSGIATDDYLYIQDGPAITVTAGNKAGHGLKANDYVRLSGGSLNVSTQAAMKKGITSDGFVLVEGGTTSINVSGGVAYDSEDGEYTGTAGIKADNYFGMTGGTVTIVNTGAGGKGIRAGNYTYFAENGSLNDSYVSGGTLTVTTSGKESSNVSTKAIKIGYKEGSGRSYVNGGNLLVSGGSISASSAQGESVEAKGKITVTGGSLYAYSGSDDAINSQGEMNVTGGYVYGHSTGNDGIDSNGDMKLSGGYVFAITTRGSPEVALDANTEGGYKLYINSGATLVAYGGLENGYSASQSVYSMSCSAGGWNGLWNGSSFIAAFKAPSGVSSVAVSAPSLSQGYTGVSAGEPVCNGVWAADGISGGTAVSLTTYSGGQGGPGGGGGWPGGPGGGGRPW